MIPGPELEGRLRSAMPEGTFTDDPADIGAFRQANPVLEPAVEPSYVLRPSKVDELRRLVQLANEVDLNLTVSSSTGAHEKGGFAAKEGNVLIDLSNWRGIPWINRRNRVCLIEPGVTYGELLEALEPYGMTIPTPLSPRAGKSVVASVMDREPTIWPNRQWDISDPVASTEFIFGNGDVFRTGAAGGPGTLEQQRAMGGAQKSSQGPSQTDFHRVVQGSQGTMGVVTWITLRTELRPTLERPFLLGADSLDALVPFVYDVQRQWLGEHSFVLNRTAAAMLASARGGGEFDVIRSSLPSYVCLLNVAGFERMPEPRVRYQCEDIGSIASANNLTLATFQGLIQARALLDMATSPGGETDWRHHLRGNCLSLFFLTTLDRASGLINDFFDLASSDAMEEGSVGVYIQPVVQNHACHVELMCPFDPGRPGDVELMRKLEKEAVTMLAQKGAYFSRPYGSAGEVVFGQNPLGYEVLKKTKAIFDPRGVLNRGKWGL
ncbi:MAG TPA: FAD-binding oxidoreductase [Conexivisphaerales archaeon]|nr:FAD-binding oxidoreductase [Conexivisphaerales archaeon]